MPLVGDDGGVQGAPAGPSRSDAARALDAAGGADTLRRREGIAPSLGFGMICTMRLTPRDLATGAGVGATVYLLLGPSFGLGFIVAFVATSSLGWALLAGTAVATAMVVGVIVVGVRAGTDR
jgi:hypothetical protein